MEMMTLKDGAQVPAPTVMTTAISLQALLNKSATAFFELAELARNPDHKIWGGVNYGSNSAWEALEDSGPVTRYGDELRLHDDTKAVILNSTEGEGLQLGLASPIAGTPQ